VVARVSSPVFVGRVAEIGELEAAFQRAAAGQPVTVVVAGEAGVGKTRLVAELVNRSAGEGVTALAGACLNVGDGVLPYAPVVEVLRQLHRSLDEDELSRVLGEAGDYLARLVPELASPHGDGQRTERDPPGRMFELVQVPSAPLTNSSAWPRSSRMCVHLILVVNAG
jgi:predicted ATPase